MSTDVTAAPADAEGADDRTTASGAGEPPMTQTAPPTGTRALKLPPVLVVAIGNLKGGVGKTTSAFFLAVYFAVVHGKRVLVIDADPLSQSGYSWYRKLRKRGLKWPFDLESFPSKHVDDFIEDKIESAQWDVIIVDTGGESPEILKAAVRCSHELLMVGAPNDAEMERIPSTFEAAAEATAGSARAINVRVLLTKIPTVRNSTEEKKSRKDLAEADYEVLTNGAHNWQWYREAVGSTNPIDDLAEYRAIGDEVVAEYMVDAA
ncbi:ParA family protein [Actinomadura montaniterrae]|uniref:ParA family protein n=1 Tax=Actinomadura montaniterrae TaxID=1803903 RepID=A0A6L3VPD4_9ACTN|nr:ParA family protein [Actinomadura montaniterrae]KAB2376973.1 ParA family protein [Actinomadura montaniterrae]